MRSSFAGLIVVVSLSLAGCPPPPPPQGPAEPPPADPVDKPPADPVDKPPADPVDKPPADPVDKPPADPIDKPPPAAGADGGACRTASDCQSGICEGLGCGDNKGRCASKQRACTMDMRPYCGCDGATFRTSGTCPGRRFAYRGECKSAGTKKAVGAACLQASECQSGVCEGQGCGAASPGRCAALNRRCTRDRRAYCGCDGKTHYGSGSCPGLRYANGGACNVKQPAGAACNAASECQSGICEGQGCPSADPLGGGKKVGTCASRARMCTKDLRPYCGCDGKTFQTSGSCPGRLYAHRGACTTGSVPSKHVQPRLVSVLGSHKAVNAELRTAFQRLRPRLTQCARSAGSITGLVRLSVRVNAAGGVQAKAKTRGPGRACSAKAFSSIKVRANPALRRSFAVADVTLRFSR